MPWDPRESDPPRVVPAGTLPFWWRGICPTGRAATPRVNTARIVGGAFGTSLWAQEGFVEQEWNPTLRFSDGSRVWIIPELSIELPDDRIVHRDPITGDPAPEPYVSLIEVAEHPGCLYRVWSSFGPDHVEYLVNYLRYVEN